MRLDDGKEVRLLGILAPRASDAGASPGTWPPESAQGRALADLVQGQSVSLAFAGRRADRYDRVLAHVFTTTNGVPVWVQGQLVEQGHARADPRPGLRRLYGRARHA